ncbi:MAG: nucleotidyltransferase substrate binding protein [Ignavibacteria bacterium]|nr:nucleotidyltransferase substrate binding protein [Ignavibacteria bacterium]
MDSNTDIRWMQRFSNYKDAFSRMKLFLEKGELNELEEQGLIKSFEYTYELAWNVLKDYLEYQGETAMTDSRDAIRKAFNAGLINNGEVWLEMLESRNRTSHAYSKEIANEVISAIRNNYYNLFFELEEKFSKLSKEEK